MTRVFLSEKIGPRSDSASEGLIFIHHRTPEEYQEFQEFRVRLAGFWGVVGTATATNLTGKRNRPPDRRRHVGAIKVSPSHAAVKRLPVLLICDGREAGAAAANAAERRRPSNHEGFLLSAATNKPSLACYSEEKNEKAKQQKHLWAT